MRIFQMQRISAIAVLVFLTIHMVVLHYPPFHVDFSRVIDRLSQPLWQAIDVAFLFFVLMHAVTGAYMVLTDVEKIGKYRRALSWAAVVIAVLAFIYGTQTILAFQTYTPTLGAVLP